LAQHRDRFGGTVKLMFQPAEEGLGGAKAMIEDGVLKGPEVDVAFGLHVSSNHDTGTAVVRPGALLAASDRLHIVVRGRGGHAAHPEQTVDAVLVAAQIVVALQTIVARNIDPEQAAVITIGSIHAGEASNVIAETAELRGSIRSFDPEVRATLHRRIHEVATGVAAALGATAEVNTPYGVDATVNAPAPTALVQTVAAEVLGSTNVNTTYRSTGGEDFSAVLSEVPGQFFFLGSRNRELGTHFPHHNPRFDVDESCFPYGVAILCETAVRALAGE
jgi:amidohydrolase